MREKQKVFCREVRRHAVAAEVLEERVLMAMSLKAGGSGYSNLLATDSAALRQQKLIIDPPEPQAGSTSTLYDPKLVTLRGATPGPGYDNAAFGGFVEVRINNDTRLQDLDSFLRQPAGVETGYVQIRYALTGQAGQIPVPRGWIPLDVGGTEGMDTHELDFALRPDVSPDIEMRYRVFAAKQGEHSGNQEDFLITNDGTRTRLGPDQLSSAEASTRPKDGSISGTVFFDANADRQRGPDEPAMGGVTVYVDLDRDGKPAAAEPTTASNELGGYFFDNLLPGDYVVREITPQGMAETTDVEGDGHPAHVVAGRRVRFVDFGNARAGAVSGTVFNDVDGDGVRDAGEPGLAGALVYVDVNDSGTRDAGEPAATSTDPAGAWTIGSLAPGTYVLRQLPPVGMVQTAPVGGSQTIVVTSGANTGGVEFGDRTGPRVVDVFVRGSSWSAAFLKQLAAQRLGGDPAGYRVSAAGAAVPLLPWVNLNQVVVRFDQPVNVDAGDLVVRGVRADYVPTAVAPLTGMANTYVFTLGRPLGGDGSASVNGDRLVLDLDGDAPGGVTPAGRSAPLLDGDFDGRPGGDYRLRFDVLQGDVTRNRAVNLFDSIEVLRGFGSVVGISPGYSLFRDLNGSGAVTGTDVVLVRSRIGRTLPAVQAPAAVDPTSIPRPARRSLFGDQPVID